MNLLKEVLKHEVLPAMGCTEPVAVALAVSYASKAVGGDIFEIYAELDPGTYKNGMNVVIPGTNGKTGIPIAAALGAICCEPKNGLELLKNVKKENVEKAEKMIRTGRIKLKARKSKTDLYIKVRVKSNKGEGVAVIENSHTNLVRLKLNGTSLFKQERNKNGTKHEYVEKLQKYSLKDMVEIAKKAGAAEIKYIEEGVKINKKAVKEGLKYNGYAKQLIEMQKTGKRSTDIFSEVKIAVAAASDGRMAGMSLPVMSSGGSGNQGVVSILVPYMFGEHNKIPRKRILQSVALSHLLNSYVKTFEGKLSPVCHCAIAAGVGAAAACVFQKCYDIKKITNAINNIANDLGGMFCNGANSGCAMKVASSASSALSAAIMALEGFCTAGPNGIIGHTAEETIQNLSRITSEGMHSANEVILKVMEGQTHVYS